MTRSALYRWNLVLAVGCVAGSVSDAQAQRTDTIVRSVSLRPPPTPRPAVERLSVGTVHGPADYALTTISDLARGTDGSMLVLEAPFIGTPALRLFSATGQFLRYVGRVGEGPGEYIRPGAIATFPDGRFLLLDHMNRRLTVYSAGGDHLETWSIPFYRIAFGWGSLMRIAPDGTIAIRFISGPLDQLPLTQAVVRLREGGEVLDTLPEPALPDIALSINTESTVRSRVRIDFSPVPYSPLVRWVWSPRGYFVTGRSDRYALDLLLPRPPAGGAGGLPRWTTGNPVLSIRADAAAVPVSQAERADQRNHKLRQISNASHRIVGRMPEVPRTKPFFKQFNVGEDGRLWIILHTPSVRYTPDEQRRPDGAIIEHVAWREQEQLADVFEPDGRYLGRVQLPPDLRIRLTTGNEIWGYTQNEFGIPFLKKYVVQW